MRVFAEHLLGKEQKYLLEVGETDFLIDIQSLYLMEETVGTSRDGLIAIHTTWAEHTNGGLLLFHHTSLNRTGVGTEDDVWMCLDKERVLHVAGRMIVREVHG